MIVPTVHRNGTSKSRLLEQYGEARQAVHFAIAAVIAAGPHGRDYYPQGPGTLEEANKEHHARIEKLSVVEQELLALIEVIDRA